jgi:hypothetical protein
MFGRDAALLLFRRQNSDRFSFDVEILCIATKAALRIQEVGRSIGITFLVQKVNRVVDSSRMLRDVLRFRVLHRNVTPEQYAEFAALQQTPAQAATSTVVGSVSRRRQITSAHKVHTHPRNSVHSGYRATRTENEKSPSAN